MPRETLVDSRQEILRTAARLFQQRGYDATSMNDVAAALKLSKGGLYHHFQSKDEILFEIMAFTPFPNSAPKMQSRSRSR